MVPCATAPPPPPRYMKAAPAAAKLSRWALVIMADVSRWRVDRAGHVRTRAADHANSRIWNVRSRQTVVKPMSAARFASKLSIAKHTLFPVPQPVHQRLLLAAVDLDHAAVDHVREWGCQHGDEVAAFLHLGDAAERDRGGRKLVRLLVGKVHVARHGSNEAGPALGAHRPGIDGDEADVVLAVLAGERFRQLLAGRVGGARHDLPIGRLDAIVADQVHDSAAALLDHDGQHVAQAAHIAHELELQALLPVGFREVLEHAARRRAGIVDHDVHAAERLVPLLDEVLGIGVFGEIGRDGDDLAVSFPGDLGGGGFEHVLAPGADRDIYPLFRQRAGDAFADPLAAAGYQRGLACELKVHVELLMMNYVVGLWASQRPASAAENSSASAAFTAAGSSLLMVWPARGMTRSAAVGAVRLRKTLPSRQRSSSSPTITRSGTENRESSPSISHRVGRLSCTLSIICAWPSAECSASMRENSAKPRGSLCLNACRIGASAYLAAADAMPSSANICPVSAASAFMASRLSGSGVEPQPQPAAVTDRHR